MSDWRSKPRNGRAEFLKHEAFIQARIAAGETHKAIYQYLRDHEELDMSLSQFNRYINKLAAQANNALTPIPHNCGHKISRGKAINDCPRKP